MRHIVLAAAALCLACVTSGCGKPLAPSIKYPDSNVHPVSRLGATADLTGQAVTGGQARSSAACPTGAAGSYKVTEFLDGTSPVSDGNLARTIAIPQASCYPHCKPDQGDLYVYLISDPGGDELANPHEHSNGEAEAALEGHSLSQISPTTLRLAITARTIALTWHVEADKIRHIAKLIDETTDSGSLAYNDPFFVVVEHASLPALSLTTREGTAQLSVGDLDSNLLPQWLVETIAPQQLGALTVYTLKVIKPECR